MKKLAVLVLVVCLALCPTLAAHAEAAQNGEQVIAVIPKSLLYDYWQYVRIGTQKAGLDYGYTIDFQGTASDTDLEGQIKLVEDFIQRGVAAIVISPVDPDGMVPVLKQAQEEYGIPVVIMDGRLNADFPYSTVSTDDHAAGMFAGEKTMELLGEEGGKVAVISAVAGAVQEGGRAQGFIDAIVASGNANYQILGPFYGDGDRFKTYSIMQDVLTANPDLKAAFSCNEGSSAGALLGVQEHEGELTFVAFDPNADMHDPIRQGVITAGVAQNPFLIGYTATQNVIKVLKGEQVEKKIAVPVTWITAENIDQPEIQNVLTPVEVIQ
ncbi:MAG: ABC transporter substrate-binding protein [Clostridiales bacterium]|jgi:ribose transport system substrate-binding protein|nr:ABC transporter substrate-binding protein [Clostridiales bacterium]